MLSIPGQMGGARFHYISTPRDETTYVVNFWKRPAYGTITADSNPVQLGPGGTGVTNLFWSSSQAATVEVHGDSPSGPLFARTGPGNFSAVTGTWVQEGTKLFLRDVSGGQPLTSEFTLDSVTLQVTKGPVASITANPNPFVPDSGVLGQTSRAWTSATLVEIHVDAPNWSPFCWKRSRELLGRRLDIGFTAGRHSTCKMFLMAGH